MARTQKLKINYTMLVIGGVIGLFVGAFIPDTLNPMTVVKKLTSKTK